MAQTILIAGAGKSSTYLIHYLLSHAPRNKWRVIVADGSAEALAARVQDNPYAEPVVLDITDDTSRRALVQRADIVLSVMPPQLHILLAKDCLDLKKHLITSSYISPEMAEMHAAVREAGLMFMCEMGLDPGIDHMTASQIIHATQRIAATITCFKSYCGGLIAPESDDNPWHYKFSWNPRNIVTAGMDGARYLLNNKVVEVPYSDMFATGKRIKVTGLGALSYYPNRDSLRYLDLYDVPDIRTFMRATLRHPDFIKGWQALIHLGLTDPSDRIDTKGLTFSRWIKEKTAYQADNGLLRAHVAQKLNLGQHDKIMNMLQWLGLFDEKPIATSGTASSADILLELLQEKWQMAPGDKDMVVMQHEVEYTHKDRKNKLTSTMVLKGEDRDFSAMAKTVGLPMGILARMVLNNKIVPPHGVHIPNMPVVYRPVLNELAHHGIQFTEEME